MGTKRLITLIDPKRNVSPEVSLQTKVLCQGCFLGYFVKSFKENFFLFFNTPLSGYFGWFGSFLENKTIDFQLIKTTYLDMFFCCAHVSVYSNLYLNLYV